MPGSRRRGGGVQLPFLLEGAYSGSAQFSTPELKSYLALKDVAFIEGQHGVQLESLPTTVLEGQALLQPGCEKGLSSWAQARHRSAQKASLVCVRGSPVASSPPGHLKSGGSVPESLRKSDTKMQVCNCSLSQGTSLSFPSACQRGWGEAEFWPRANLV